LLSFSYSFFESYKKIASTSFWLSIVLDLNDEQLCEARLMDYGISYARTIAVS